MSKRIRCAIYTRKSTEEGLEQDFNSLDAQREACEAFIQSQRGLGWVAQKKRYDDGGISGGTMERPALLELLADIEAGKVDLVVVYKVDRLTRSLMDFSKIIETFDAKEVSFVSVTQQFNTANSMGRLTLNVLLSFAQFEREVTAERIRDKIAASKKKGMWMGGLPPLGYDAVDKKLVVNAAEAKTVRFLFDNYLKLGSIRKLKAVADREGIVTKRRQYDGRTAGAKPFTRGHLAQLLKNPIYVGDVMHRGKVYAGQHDGIVTRETWDAVQSMLNGNARKRWSPTNKDHRCLLTGLIYDETGDRLTSTYASKKGRRYRYYISSRLVGEPNAKDGWRLAADEIERAVMDGVIAFLADHARTAVAAVHEDAEEKIRTLLHKIVVAPGNLRIEISKSGLSDLTDIEPGAVQSHVVDLPFTIRRRGVENRIVIPGSGKPLAPDADLIKVVATARAWFTSLATGEAETIKDIAQTEDVDPGDVSRFLPLAFLAPDIVEAILDGKQPVELTAEKLKRLRSLPYSWEDQRKVLGSCA